MRYQTLDKSWTRERRVVAKVEHLPRGENPRFIVTSVPVQECAGRRLYEVVYCGRGEMENRIKEQQLGLFADRTSSRKLAANQLRLYFSSFAYVMLQTVAPGGGWRGRSWRSGAVLDDPAGKIAEDRGPGPGHEPQSLAVLFRELSVCGAVEDGSDASASPPASLLATDGKNSLDDGDLGVPRMDCAPEWAPGRESSLRSAGWASKGSGEALHLAVGRHVRARKLPLELVWIKNHPDDGSTSVYCSTDEKCRLARISHQKD